ncbi:MAG TPA: RDD family protein [Vicinamibacterales bacterium]|nr:RDD family protein [Vicinamibacterales bacterium]
MKCPKCAYLGFESGDCCRNCGYNFSLSPSFPSETVEKPGPLDFVLDREVEQARPALDLDRVIGGLESADPAAELPLFGGGGPDDAPLITPSRPRAPLGVRRATPEVPRARPRTARSTTTAGEMLFESPPAAVLGRAFESRSNSHTTGDSLAAPSSRIMAALVDASIISVLDSVVLYFTLRLCGLVTGEIFQLPILPLAAFFLLLNGGYFIAFTAVGGQSIGKMALGIKVIAEEDGAVPVGRATIRTLAYLVSALPFGAGFLPGVMSADRLALHDRLAHTRVVRPSST